MEIDRRHGDLLLSPQRQYFDDSDRASADHGGAATMFSRPQFSRVVKAPLFVAVIIAAIVLYHVKYV